MGEGRSIWVGKDEHHGVRAQPRKDLKPPPHWRLEAVAATPMPRSLMVGPDRRRAVFIEDRDTSDVWLLDLEAGSVPERLTTGREPANWWEDTPPRLSPDGSTVAYADEGHVWLVPTAGGPPRKLVGGRRPALDRRPPARDHGRARRGHDHAARGRRHRRPVAAPPGRRARRPRRARRRGRAGRVPGRHRGGLHVHAARRPVAKQRDPRGRRSTAAPCAA